MSHFTNAIPHSHGKEMEEQTTMYSLLYHITGGIATHFITAGPANFDFASFMIPAVGGPQTSAEHLVFLP